MLVNSDLKSNSTAFRSEAERKHLLQQHTFIKKKRQLKCHHFTMITKLTNLAIKQQWLLI